MPEYVVPRNEGEPNLTEQVNWKLLKEYLNSHWWSCGPQYNGPSSLPGFKKKDETSRVQNFCQRQILNSCPVLLWCYAKSQWQMWWSSMSTLHWFHLLSDLCDHCSDTMIMYFPFSLTLPWSEELRSWDWIQCYTISLSEIRNLYQKQYEVDLQCLQREWSDWCYWDVSVVTSPVQFVLHELHPDDIVFKVIHGGYTNH